MADLPLQLLHNGSSDVSLSDLEAAGFDVMTANHAMAVLTRDFPGPLDELCDAVSQIEIPDVELIRSGGGEAQITQRLRRALTEKGWRKRNVVIRKIVDDEEREATSHEIDHVRRAPNGALALEIEWNNKDPFYDRDLENFQRLHAEGVISVGMIITRGASLHGALRQILHDCVVRHGIQNYDDLINLSEKQPTPRQREMVQKSVTGGRTFADAWSRMFVSDKFGAATTHWSKLRERLDRGVGNPCPLLLIGIAASVIRRA